MNNNNLNTEIELYNGRPYFYMLDKDNFPVPCSMEDSVYAKDHVGKDYVWSITWKKYYPKIERVFISTVFLGIDHNHSQVGEPILFETMIFSGKYDQFQERYRTWLEARENHVRIVNKLKWFRSL